MVEFLDSFISINSVIWLFLVAFMLHDFEEIIRIEPWFRRHQPSIYRKVPRRFRNTLDSFSRMTAPQFSVAVCLEFVVFVPCTFMAAEHGSYLLFLGFNAVMLLHVFYAYRSGRIRKNAGAGSGYECPHHPSLYDLCFFTGC